MSKERAIKQEKLKEAEVEGSAEGIGPETKKRKTGKSQKQLVLSEEKEVEQPLAIRTRVNTKVKSSFSQVPVSSLVHGSLGPSRCTRSKQKRLGDLVEREREGQGLFHSSLFYVVVCCYFVELMSDYFLCSPSVSQTLRKAEANHLVKTWYGFPLFMPSVVCFHPLL